ncbi:TetR/AcrR family transcriptional regulator [Azospirillum sp. ST 5-10]|uniref:TetR/AcrR family transcriptional regulator n=1 Tax=unclassified Azospirillum TaxID=2630922 RepID=UPI003F4A59F1
MRKDIPAATGKALKQNDSAKERILDAAETLFGELGYGGATARRIADEAGVPVALINYHFGSKEGLYRAIFEKRTPAIYDQRVVGLQLARSEPNRDRRIELVIKALIVPMLGLRGGGKASAFGRILARELSDPAAESRGIFREMFDPVAQMMIDAIAECFPEWTAAEVHWAYHTMLGAMMIVMMDNGRIARLSGGAASAENHEEAARHIVAILTAGLKHRDRSQTAAD